ncbi:CrcB family protein, partial [Streptomyces sp. NPDC006129]|uniref:fluoride efflux transporter FluC n=1 Tax=Streptomyces sp. NPDC006129 TaxID=3155348 RepID=UPI0033A7A46F
AAVRTRAVHGCPSAQGGFPGGRAGRGVGAKALKPARQGRPVLLGTGLCGALTTYSTFSHETLRLAETGARFFAAANVVASVVAGLGAVFVGAAIAEAVWG